MQNLVKWILLCSFFLISWSGISLAATSIFTIKLQYKTATEMVPHIQPFLDKGAKISANGDTLILRTSTQNIAEIKQLVSEIDVPSRQLKITIAKGNKPEEQHDTHTNYSTVNNGDNSLKSVQVNDGQMARLQEDKIVALPGLMQGYKQKFNEEDWHAMSADIAVERSDLQQDISDQELKVVQKQRALDDITTKEPLTQNFPAGTYKNIGQTRDQAIFTATRDLENEQIALDRLLEADSVLAKELENLKAKDIDIDTTSGALQYEYANLPAGLYVKPRLLTNQRLVEVEVIHMQASQGQDLSRTSNTLETTLQTPVGTWINISGDTNTNTTSRSFSTKTSKTNAKDIWLKVDVVK